MQSTTETTRPTDVIQTIFELLNRREAEALTHFVADEIVEHWPLVGRLEGRDAVAAHFGALFAAMPDFRIEIERIASEGKTVFVHWHASGTFSGEPFYGLQATGRPIDLRGTDCFTVRDGKVVANFIAYDGLAWAVQAGILPAHGSRMDRAMTALLNLRTRVLRRIHR